MSGKIIAILGVAGSGKTTLGKNLARVFSTEFLEENWKDIPFVSHVGEKQSTNFEVCIGFLNMRYAQIKKAEELKLVGNTVFIDTIFEMTDIYAKQMLQAHEYSEFKKVYDVFTLNTKKPDEYIYLFGDIKTIRDRALARNLGIDLEKTMLSIEALEQAKNAIEDFFESKSEEKVTRIDVTSQDVRSDDFVLSLKSALGV